jgi:hypothetical protein
VASRGWIAPKSLRDKQGRWHTLAPPDLAVPRETAIWYIRVMEWLAIPLSLTVFDDERGRQM